MNTFCNPASRRISGGIPFSSENTSEHLAESHTFSEGSARVVLGVCGGIAAYKSPAIVRRLREAGCDVHVVPTPASLSMVGQTTWEAVSGHPVYTNVMQGADNVVHVNMGSQADLLVIAPASANTIAKLAAGMADNLLTATALVATCPVIIAPAMHTQMWNHSATQSNIRVLRERGIHVCGPERGRLTGADSGLGRMSEPDTIVQQALHFLADADQRSTSSMASYCGKESSSGSYGDEHSSRADVSCSSSALSALPLSGVNVLISAGGTREAIDPVRFIGNRSTGRMGIAVANAAHKAGASVQLVAANIEPDVLDELHSDISVCAVSSAQHLRDKMHAYANNADVIIMSAAVSDYQPVSYSESKIKKDPSGVFTLELCQTPDILKELSSNRAHRSQIIVGFAAETGDLSHSVLEYGKEKAAHKGADIMVINQVGQATGFGAVHTNITIVDPKGNELATSSGSKPEVAHTLIKIIALLRSQAQQTKNELHL